MYDKNDAPGDLDPVGGPYVGGEAPQLLLLLLLPGALPVAGHGGQPQAPGRQLRRPGVEGAEQSSASHSPDTNRSQPAGWLSLPGLKLQRLFS